MLTGGGHDRNVRLNRPGAEPGGTRARRSWDLPGDRLCCLLGLLGIPLDSVRVTVRGTLDPRGLFGVAQVPAGFSDIRCEVELVSPAATEDVTRLTEIVEARCPVLDILRRPVPVRTTIALNGRDLAPPR